MNDFTNLIAADGGKWSETEILGDRAIVKVNASPATLTTIANTATFRRIPLALLDDPLSSLSAGVQNAIKQEVLDAGYTLAEVNARFPNIASATLGDVLRFMATRRLQPRYDKGTDTISIDGPIQKCKSIDVLNAEVT
jgi:hypothetical protein